MSLRRVANREHELAPLDAGFSVSTAESPLRKPLQERLDLTVVKDIERWRRASLAREKRTAELALLESSSPDASGLTATGPGIANR